jgi:hypothetical protein
MPSLPMTLFVGVFLTVGLGLTTLGVSGFRKWWLMRRLNPNSATAETGVQEFEGRAHAVDETVTAPLTESESLICETKIEHYDSGDNGSNWDTIHKDSETVPFEVEHGGTSVAVDPENANYLLTDEYQMKSRGTDDLAPRVREYAEEKVQTGSTVELGPVELGGRRLRFTEERLDEGEEVYVLGPAERNPGSVPDGSDAKLAISPPERGLRQRLFGDPFVVSDTGEEQAKSRQLKSAGAVLFFGLSFLAGGVAVLVLV